MWIHHSLFTVILLAGDTLALGPSTCKNGKVWRNCGQGCPKTCEDKLGLGAGRCLKGCFAQCECPDDAPYELHTGECVNETQCPSGKAQLLGGYVPCRNGKVWNNCGQACPKVCSDQLGLGWGKCKAGCVPICECPQEAPIEHEGACIIPEECPDGVEHRGAYNPCRIRGQVWNNCAQECVKTCDDVLGLNEGLCVVGCFSKCECSDEAPIQHDGTCITHQQCPGGKGTVLGDYNPCTDGKVWTNCAQICAKTCYDSTGLRWGNCRTGCMPKCECPKHAPYEFEAQCLHAEQCPGGSPIPGEDACFGTQVWNNCGHACSRTCDDQSGLRGGTCHEGCVAKCECPEEAPIEHDGRCIQTHFCPGGAEFHGHYNPCKAEGEVWKNCAQACAKTCYDLDGYRQGHCPIGCFAKCQCSDEAPILNYGRCIKTEDCPADEQN